MRSSALALLAAIATVSVGAVAAPAEAAPAHAQHGQTVHAAAKHPIITPVHSGVRAHMGHYSAAQFQAAANKLPSALKAQLGKQLGMSGAQFLADGQAAADATKVLEGLRTNGVQVTGSRLSGTTLTVDVASKADAAAVTAAGAAVVVGVQPAPAPQPPIFKADVFTQEKTSPGAGTSPLLGGDGWAYFDGAGQLAACSVGFLGYSAATGAREFATAGHCADYPDTGGSAPSGDPNNVNGSVYSVYDANPNPEDATGSIPIDDVKADTIGVLKTTAFKFGGGDDYGTVPVTGSKVKPQNAVSTWGGSSTGATASAGIQNTGSAVNIIGAAAPVAGEPVCHSGDRTGWQCGTVSTTAGWTDVAASITTPSGAQLVNGFVSSIYICEGDSGGSIVSGQYAVGTLTGGSWPEPSDGTCQSAAQSQAQGGGVAIGYSLVSPDGGPSFAQNDPDFQLGVAEPAATPAVTYDTSGQPTAVSGTLAFADGTPAPAGTTVALAIDGGSPTSTLSAANSSGVQTWRFGLSGLTPGTHTYKVTVGTGRSAVSQTATFTVPNGSGTTNGTNSGTTSAPSVTRIAGSDRYATDVAASKAQFASGAPTVLLASATNYPDALAAAPAAAKLGADLLLTAPDSVPASISAELTRLKPTTVYIIGGTGAVSAAVATRVRSVTGVTPQRISGADRYATSAAIAADFFPSASAVFAATGAGFPDALSAAGAAATLKDPVLLVPGTSAAPTAPVVAQLSRLRPSSIYVVGGTGVVSNAMQTDLARTAAVTRLAGSDRYGTSAAVAKRFSASSVRAVIASGANFPDALVGSVLAGSQTAPLLLSTAACMPTAIVTQLHSMGASALTLMGGTGVLSAAVAAERQC